MSPDKPPAYLAVLLAHLQANDLEPGVHHVEVQHDDGCALLTGTGSCDCAPAVLSGPVVDGKYDGRPNRRERRRRMREGQRVCLDCGGGLARTDPPGGPCYSCRRWGSLS
jgi:hypothetical protein